MNKGVLSGMARATATGMRRVTGLIANGGLASYCIYLGAVAANALVVLKSALAANQWTDAVVINGRGCVNWAAVEAAGSVGAGAGQLLLDGAVICTTSAAIASSNQGAMLVGGFSYDTSTNHPTVVFQPLYFESQCVLQVKVTNAGTDMKAAINAEIHA